MPPTGLDPLKDPTTIYKLALDQGIQASIFTVVIFSVLGLLEGKNLSSIRKQLQGDYASTMVNNWKLWIPASFVNLAYVPLDLRVLFTSKPARCAHYSSSCVYLLLTARQLPVLRPCFFSLPRCRIFLLEYLP